MAFVALQDDCKKIIGPLSQCSNDELNEVMNDDEKIETLIAALDQGYLKNLEVEKESVTSLLNQLSETNLTCEPELVEGREQVVELSKEGEDISKRIEEKYQDLRMKGGDVSLETALALLQTAASEIEEESDNLAKRFLASEAELDAFLEEFLAKRKLMHLRLVKTEKLSKLVAQGTTTTGGNYINAPPMAINSHYFPGVPAQNPVPYLPYPMGNINMPFPPQPSYPYH